MQKKNYHCVAVERSDQLGEVWRRTMILRQQNSIPWGGSRVPVETIDA